MKALGNTTCRFLPNKHPCGNHSVTGLMRTVSPSLKWKIGSLGLTASYGEQSSELSKHFQMSTRTQIYRNALQPLLKQYQLQVEMVKREKLQISKDAEEYEVAKLSQDVLQKVAQATQQEAHKRIASVVSKCLAIVFDDPYTFKIVFERKRGKTEANLLFEREGHEIVPKAGSGGGVIDVSSFALRLSCLSLRYPRLRKLVVFDEPFKHLHSREYRSRVREMIKLLAKELDMQFVFVTGMPELATGTIIQLPQE